MRRIAIFASAVFAAAIFCAQSAGASGVDWKEINSGSPFKGEPGAPVTVTAFADFQ